MVAARKMSSYSLNVNSLFDILTFVHFTSYQFVLRVFDSQSETRFLPTFVPCLPLPRITLSLSAIFLHLCPVCSFAQNHTFTHICFLFSSWSVSKFNILVLLSLL